MPWDTGICYVLRDVRGTKLTIKSNIYFAAECERYTQQNDDLSRNVHHGTCKEGRIGWKPSLLSSQSPCDARFNEYVRIFRSVHEQRDGLDQETNERLPYFAVKFQNATEHRGAAVLAISCATTKNDSSDKHTWVASEATHNSLFPSTPLFVIMLQRLPVNQRIENCSASLQCVSFRSSKALTNRQSAGPISYQSSARSNRRSTQV